MKPQPDDNKMAELLENLPLSISGQFDRQLKNAPWTKRATIRRRVVGSSMLTLVVLTLALAFTPQGRAISQTMLLYFERSMGGTSSFIGSTQTVSPTQTLKPTHIAQLVTSSVGNTDAGVFPTPTAPKTITDGDFIYALSLPQAQELAGDEIRVPVVLPEGYRFDTAIFNTRTEESILIYKFNPYQAGEDFVLHQNPDITLDPIGQSTSVEQIKLGNTLVEYTQGTWNQQPGEIREAWDSELPTHTFRWEQAGFYFTLQFHLNESFSPAYLLREDMLAMVEVLLGLRTSLPDKLNLNNLTSYEDLEKATGFDVLTPSILPEGFAFSHAVYEPENQRVVLLFSPADRTRSSTGVNLIIFETPVLPGNPVLSWEGFPEDAVEVISIGTETGTLVHGALINDVYDPDFGLSITWKTSRLNINILFSGSGYPIQMDATTLLAFARSMQ